MPRGRAGATAARGRPLPRAQEVAARLAFGLPVATVLLADLRCEILRCHMTRLCFDWPLRMGFAPADPDLCAADEDLSKAVFGTFAPPKTAREWRGFFGGARGVAPLLRTMAAAFPEGVCATPILPRPSAATALSHSARENTAAGRRRRHPIMAEIESRHGRGLRWRLSGRVVDFGAVLAGPIAGPGVTQGVALVPVATGLYAMAAKVANGKVVSFRRVTPSDHLLAPDGVAACALGSLPAHCGALAPFLREILDPCTTVTLEHADA